MVIKKFFVLYTLIFTLTCCSQKNTGEGVAGNKNLKAIDPQNMDTTIRPGENFFKYANGTWMKKNPIPPSQSSWGSFDLLVENNLIALHKLLKESSADKTALRESGKQKVGDFYKTGMDSLAIEKAGLMPVKPWLDSIAKTKDSKQLLLLIAKLHTSGIHILYNFSIYPDEKNVGKYFCQFTQGGLGLPDRDYYFNKDERTSRIRSAYKNYLTQVLSLINKDPLQSRKEAEEIFQLETALAGGSLTMVERRDPYKVYNKFDLKTLERLTPSIPWNNLFIEMHLNGQDSCIVHTPSFFKTLSERLKTTPLSVWKNYANFHLINEVAPYLSSQFDTLHFGFYGRTLRGQQEQNPRWKRVLTTIDQSIGQLLGQMYVDEYFQSDAKSRMMELVNNLQKTFEARIKRLDWMTDTTKHKALAKLHAFVKKIGYPDKWKNYSSLKITSESYAGNILRAAEFDYNYSVNKLGKPVDKTEWEMSPPTVNAFYNASFNEIVFPAGFLQYPFFDKNADDAVNYGGIGAVIGHEMTHGFDDEGRQYDFDGNLHDWWTSKDAEAFNKKAEKVVEQFNNYTVLDSLHVNGKLTLGENLADLGGLAIAYEAYKKTTQAKENKKIDGFTPDQRFFLSWAQGWRENIRPEDLASRIITDPHSPQELRCNGPLSNMKEFYAAFSIQPSDKYYVPDSLRAKVW